MYLFRQLVISSQTGSSTSILLHRLSDKLMTGGRGKDVKGGQCHDTNHNLSLAVDHNILVRRLWIPSVDNWK